MLRVMLFLFGVMVFVISAVMIVPRRQMAVNSARIAFVSPSESGAWGIFSMDTRGGGRRFIASGKQSASSPTWSPDGVWLAFEMDAVIYKIRRNGKDLQPLAAESPSYMPAWSPDGEWIAFVATDEGDTELYRMRPDGTGVVQLTYSLNAIEMMPTWSPDGEWIAYVIGWRSFRSELFRIRPDGSELQRVIHDRFLDPVNPVWSLDGNWLVFTANLRRGRVLYRVAASDGQQQSLPIPINPGLGEIAVLYPGFSEAGNWLTFTAPDENDTYQIFKAHVGDTDFVQITFDTTHKDAAWSPPADFPWRGWVNAAAALALLAVSVTSTGPVSKRLL